MVQARGGSDYGGATRKQLSHHRSTDRVRSHTGYNRNLVGPTHRGATSFSLDGGHLADVLKYAGYTLAGTSFTHLAGPPGSLVGYGSAQTGVAFNVNRLSVDLTGGDASQVFTGTGPAVIDQYCATRVEAGSYRGYPVGA